jgi:phage-related minor tail protein
MDLQELKFVVDTKDLETAAIKVAELGAAVSKLNKPMQDLSKESVKTNKELSKAEEAAAKAALAQLKLEKAQNKSVDAANKSVSVLERQNLILEYMAQGNSKGQASILATAKAAGALDDEMLQLNNTLKTQRTLIGGDPFDKSIGLMQKLQNEYKTTTEVSNLFNRNLGLTEKQMTDLAREKERLIALYGIEGRSLNGLSAEYEQLIHKSVQINQANDARTNSMKAQIKAQNDTAKANQYLISEMERVNRLTDSNGDITSATNNKLIKFEQALKQSGQTAAQQAAALEKYKTALLSVQKAGGDRQVDYLSRALGPQITDIFVGLATGQSPLMVLLQQGGQLRDQFALAGIAGKDMGEMLTKATLGMVSSVKDVAVAVGGALGGAFLAAGKSVKTFIMDITGTSRALEYVRYQIALMDGSNGLAMKSFLAMGNVITTVVATAVFSAVAAFVAYGIALKQVIAEESALSKAINLTGGSLGLTTDSALALSESFAGSTGNVSAYLKAITEIAKAGNVTSDNLKTVATTIVEVSKITGLSAETLAKNFSKISEKPLEGLIPFAKELGTINVDILKHIQRLEKAGKFTEAAKIATEAYAGALRDAGKAMKQDMGFVEDFFFNIAKGADMVWNSILNIGRAVPIAKKLAEAEKELASLRAGEGLMTDQYRKNSIQIAEAEVAALKKQIDSQKELGQVKAKNTKDVVELEKSLKTDKKAENDAAREKKRLEKEAEKYLNRIASLTNSATKEQENYSKAQKLALDIFADPDFKNYPNHLKIAIAGAIERAHAEEMVTDELERQRKINEEVVKTRNELVEAGAKQVDAAKLSTQALVDESAMYDYKLSLVGMEEKEIEKLLAQKKIQLEYEKEIARIKSLNLLSGTKVDLEAEEYRKFILKRENLDKEANLKAATDFQKQFENLKTGISDSIVTALFEGGKSGSKKLRDILVAELKKPVTIVVNAIVNTLMGSVTGGISSSVGSIGSSLLGNSLGGLGAVGGVGGLGAGLSAGWSAAFGEAGLAGAFDAAGIAMSSGNILGGLGTALGAAAPYIAGALAIGSALGLFSSTEQRGSGIQGTLGAGNINSYAVMRESGNIFSGPSWWTEDRGVFGGSGALQTSFQALKDNVTMMADAIGVSSDKIGSFTKAISISFDGLTNEQIQQKITDTFGAIGNELAALVLGAGATAEQLSTLYNNVMQQRYDLETQLLELQGDTVALRERERTKIYDSNKALYDQVNALKDKQAADEAAAEAMQKLTSVTTTIVDEINRLRGVNTSSTALESQFAILTAQARSGDLAALAQLPDVTKGLEQIASSSAVNATDVIIARARLAQSLQDTLGYVGAGGLLASSTPTASISTVSSVSATGSATTVSATSSNQELLAALVTEVQGLRAEVRADVSHNAKTAKILERVNQDGESLTITTLV